MLAPNIYRQRCSIEFLTEQNLYDSSYITSLLENFLTDLCATLGMQALHEPIVCIVPDGVSAYMLWAESGVQVHSWFAEKFVSIDVYSCKSYMVSDIINVINYWFDPTAMEVI